MRKKRELKKDAVYHVSAKINRGEFLFEEDVVKDLFLNTVKRAKKKYNFRLDSFCVMENHIHLIIKPLGDENLSSIMQWILSVFAINFNRIYKTFGHVWNDRFKSKIIEGVRNFLQVFKYVSENPVKAGLAVNPWEYRYSGVHHIRNGDFSVVAPPLDIIKDVFHHLFK